MNTRCRCPAGIEIEGSVLSGARTPDRGAAAGAHARDIRHLAVAGRDHGPGSVGDYPLRIAEKPQEEHGQQARWQCPDWGSQPTYKYCSSSQRERVIVAVGDHREIVRIIVQVRRVGRFCSQMIIKKALISAVFEAY